MADVELSLLAVPENVAVVRHVFGGIAGALGMDPVATADLRLAISEACTNAVVHGYDGAPAGAMRLTATVDGALLHVSVSDDGPGIAPRADSPGLGLGLPLIGALADEVRIGGSEKASEVRMTFVVGG